MTDIEQPATEAADTQKHEPQEPKTISPYRPASKNWNDEAAYEDYLRHSMS